jgi:hypothetical protein
MLSPAPGIVWGEILLILTLIFTGLLDLLFARGILGFADNFRRVFELDPTRYYREASYRWSKTEFTGDFLLGFALFLCSSILGFASIFYGLYYVFGEKSFRNLLCKDWPVQLQLIYFSLVTIATVGYGDIQPAIGWTQVAAGLEILFGLGFVVIFLFGLQLTLSYDRTG